MAKQAIAKELPERPPQEKPEESPTPEPMPESGIRTKEQESNRRRSKRARKVRAQTINVNRLSKQELREARAQYPEPPPPLPRCRAECQEGPRPCVRVSCRYNLYLDVNPRNGAIKLNFPDLEPGEMQESCALDIADQGGAAVPKVAEAMNMTRERVRQLEIMALEKLAKARPELREYISEDRRRLPVLCADELGDSCDGDEG